MVITLANTKKSQEIRSDASSTSYSKQITHAKNNDTFSRYTEYHVLAKKELEQKGGKEIKSISSGMKSAPKTSLGATKKVLSIYFNPILESHGNKRLHQFVNGHDPKVNENLYIQALKSVSGGYVNYTIVDKVEVDGYPRKQDGFTYTDDSYISCYQDSDPDKKNAINLM